MSGSTDGLLRARQLQQERKEQGIKTIIKNPLEKLATNPKSLRLAINAKCFDCVGQDADPDWRGRVRECPMTDCGLYAVRPCQIKNKV